MSDFLVGPHSWPHLLNSPHCYGLSPQGSCTRGFSGLATDMSPGEQRGVDPHYYSALLDVSSRNFYPWARSAYTAGSAQFSGAGEIAHANYGVRSKNRGGRHSRPETKAEEETTMGYIVAAVTAAARVAASRGVYGRAQQELRLPPANINRSVDSLRASYRNARRRMSPDEDLVRMYESRLRLQSSIN